jgi:hypothetical protein
MEKYQLTGAATFPHVYGCDTHNDEEDRLCEPINEEFALPILPIDP